MYNHTFPIPDPSSWSSLYKSPELYVNPFLQMLIEASPIVRKIFEMLFVAQKSIIDNDSLGKLLANETDFAEFYELFDDLLKLSSSHMKDHFDDTDVAPEEQSVFQRYMEANKMGLAFLYLIAFPCMLLFKESPASLL